MLTQGGNQGPHYEGVLEVDCEKDLELAAPCHSLQGHAGPHSDSSQWVEASSHRNRTAVEGVRAHIQVVVPARNRVAVG